MANTTNIGIPPYIQGNSSGDNFSLNSFDPETGTEMQALNRKQQIANLLVQQSLTPRQGQMVGNVYVPAGWGQGLAQIGQAIAGAYMTRQNDKARAHLESQNQQNVANALASYQESQQGRPALTVPDGSQGPERPEMPATPEGQRMGLVRLMANQNPAVQRFAQYEAQRQAKAAEMQAQQQNALALEAAKAKSAAELKTVVSGDAALANSQHVADRSTIAAVDQAKLDQEASKQAQAVAQHQADRTTISAVDQAKLDAEKAALEQKDRQFAGVSGADQLRAQTDLAKHGTASADTLANIDARAQLQNQDLAVKQAALAQQHERERQQLELDRNKFANLQDYQKAELALKDRQLAQTAELKQAELAQQKELHATPSGNALASVDVQAQQSLQQHNDRVAQMEQNARQDQATLELRRQQGMSDLEYKRERAAMEDRHNKAQEQLTREGHAIQEAFHKAQIAKGASSVENKRETANYNAGLKEVAQDQKGVEAANALQGDLQRWQELQDKVETGPIAGRRPISFNPDYQELKQLENKLAINNFKPGQGQISNFERTLIKGAGPTTLNDAATNKNIVQIMLGGMQNMKERADFKEWYLEQHGKMLGADKAWNEYVEQNPRFTKDKAGNIVPNANRQDWMTHFSGGPSAPAPTTSVAPSQSAQVSTPQAPAVGTIKGGYRFKGGDPSSPSSWEKQ